MHVAISCEGPDPCDYGDQTARWRFTVAAGVIAVEHREPRVKAVSCEE